MTAMDAKITVKGQKTAEYPDIMESISRRYAEDRGLRMIELRSVQSESDFANGVWMRESEDNGRTWGEYRDVNSDHLRKVGENDEVTYSGFDQLTYDPSSGNYVGLGMMRYFIDGHTEAYARYWQKGEDAFRDHGYLVYKCKDGSEKRQLLMFEGEGHDYDPNAPRDPEFLSKNLALPYSLNFASNGDLLFSLCADVRACCRLTGASVSEIFPSCPQLMQGLIVARAHWDGDKQKYTLSYSKPVVISDVQSSRGVCEPCVAELSSGRIIAVFRGSNVVSPNWNSRISPHAPGFKWYAYSDDGGKTFTPAMPWHFDTREVVYSSATYSVLFKASKNGKTYWIGNITEPTETYGNSPRFPLVICEVDEKYACLKKDTLTVIDTIRDGESKALQLSNFTLLENRETGALELRLSKIGGRIAPGQAWNWGSESWMYEISFE